MNPILLFRRSRLLLLFAISACAIGSSAYQASSIPQERVIQPEELARIIHDPGKDKPVILQVGSRVLFEQAHIPGSEYIGAASTEAGLQSLKKRVEALPKNQAIVLYCGCCPWNHCPNVQPADKALSSWGFTNVKTLYIGTNFGVDWVQKGYPSAKGD